MHPNNTLLVEKINAILIPFINQHPEFASHWEELYHQLEQDKNSQYIQEPQLVEFILTTCQRINKINELKKQIDDLSISQYATPPQDSKCSLDQRMQKESERRDQLTRQQKELRNQLSQLEKDIHTMWCGS